MICAVGDPQQMGLTQRIDHQPEKTYVPLASVLLCSVDTTQVQNTQSTEKNKIVSSLMRYSFIKVYKKPIPN